MIQLQSPFLFCECCAFNLEDHCVFSHHKAFQGVEHLVNKHSWPMCFHFCCQCPILRITTLRIPIKKNENQPQYVGNVDLPWTITVYSLKNSENE